MQLTLGQFISSQRAPVPPVVEANLKGKTVVVTGANNGIGMEAAKHFAKMKPQKLILACRSKERGEAAIENIKKETGCENLELWILDLSKFASVQDFAQRFEQEGGGRLDILVENAAIIPTHQFQKTEDGWETCFQVNNLSTSLLALLLLPQMVKTAKEFDTMPKLVVVTSEVHYWAKIDKAVLEAKNPLQFYGSKENYTAKAQANRYAETKLLNVFFVRALNERLQNKSLIVDAVNPGYCLSGLRSSFSGARAVFDWFMEKALAHTAEEGSRQLVWAALGSGDSPDSMRGAYISNMEVTEPSDYVISEEGRKIQDRLWDNLIDELIKIDPTVQDIVKEYLMAPPREKADPLPESAFQGI